MNENEELYKQFKRKVKASPFLCNNLPESNLNTKCDVCGRKYDYRYAPMVTNSVWEQFKYGSKLVCVACMEKANHGKLHITQLSPSFMSVNYLFCNNLHMDNTNDTKKKLNEFIHYINHLIKQHD